MVSTFEGQEGVPIIPADEEHGPPESKLPPAEWAKKNLLYSPTASVLTLVFAFIGLYLGYRGLRFLFVTGQWDAVRVNLTLFMEGTFDRDQQWRLVAQSILLGLAVGMASGSVSATAEDRAREAEIEWERSSPTDVLRRFWPLILLVLVLLSFARTAGPWMLVLATLTAGTAGFFGAAKLPQSKRRVTCMATAIVVIAAFQVVIGTIGAAWVPLGLVLAIWAWTWADRFQLSGWQGLVARIVVSLIAAVLVRSIYRLIAFEGVGWDDWSGLHLTFFLAASSIVLAFPVGLLLALARRSTLPALRMMATVYIEVIRGVPLISLLLMGSLFLGFFLGTEISLAEVTRAIVAITLFASAYIAEIVRGGLQALPKGQTEAGQALGLSPPKIMRLVVLPQALRSVIPAMVGQFISLFKDTSLVTIIALTDVLNVRELVHSQAAFRGTAEAETLVFVAFIYWACSYSMSRESRRLEDKLGVGIR